MSVRTYEKEEKQAHVEHFKKVKKYYRDMH